jgi:alkanesulfonate monooxygenase SsuD/methylene tetrahydromethanopterin reductase-like flavin-dependent oxidoreductase (luciferase family)
VTEPASTVLSIALPGTMEPERVVGAATRAEQLGFREVWLAEDYCYSAAIPAAAAALGRTDGLVAGLGIVSALVRHPAVLAMELATVSRMYPGRLRGGIGVGLPEWMRQLGVMPASPLTAMRRTMHILRELLDGRAVTDHDGPFTLDDVRLQHPPAERVPLDMGVVGPRMVELAGEVADGLVLGFNSGTSYVRWARERLAGGAKQAGRPADHRLTCFAFFSVAETSEEARAAVREQVGLYLALGGRNAVNDVEGLTDEILALRDRGGIEEVQRRMPDAWIDQVAIAGTPEECAERVGAYARAGVDSLALYPLPAAQADEILARASEHLMPLLQ